MADLASPPPSGAPAASASVDAPKPSPPPPQGGADDRSTTFRPIEGGSQIASGEKLLVEAYAAFWLILLGFLVFTWRTQRKLDQRLTSLKADLEKAKAASSGGA